MTGSELKTLRHTARLSARKMAAAMGVSDGRVVRRWEARDHVPEPIAMLAVFVVAEIIGIRDSRPIPLSEADSAA